jgi:hypothetical protein
MSWLCFSRTSEEEKAADKKLTGDSTISIHPFGAGRRERHSYRAELTLSLLVASNENTCGEGQLSHADIFQWRRLCRSEPFCSSS